jgi:hypothetical protein
VVDKVSSLISVLAANQRMCSALMHNQGMAAPDPQGF